MASAAERKRRSRARSIARTEANRQARSVGGESVPEAKPAAPNTGRQIYVRRTSGLEALNARGRISAAEALQGERYGHLYRVAVIESPAQLRSCLDDSPRGGGGGAPATVLEAAEWIAQSRAELDDLNVALGRHAGLVAACVVVCGKSLHPGEVTPDKRAQEEIVGALRIALQLLVQHDTRRRSENAAARRGGVTLDSFARQS